MAKAKVTPDQLAKYMYLCSCKCSLHELTSFLMNLLPAHSISIQVGMFRNYWALLSLFIKMSRLLLLKWTKLAAKNILWLPTSNVVTSWNIRNHCWDYIFEIWYCTDLSKYNEQMDWHSVSYEGPSWIIKKSVWVFLKWRTRI